MEEFNTLLLYQISINSNTANLAAFMVLKLC